MELSRFLRLLPPKINIRVRVQGIQKIFVGTTGPRKTLEFLNNVYSEGKQYPEVYAIYPLYSAKELYIECY